MMLPILVIEDNAANLELMTYLLHAYSYETVTASGGEEGLRLARQARPQVILCDVQMPGMGGFEVLRALKSDPSTQAIPVVAVTALAMVGDRDRIVAAGFDGYIGKPIVPETFVSQVERFLAVKSAELPKANVDRAHAQQPRKDPQAEGIRILAVDNTPANLDLLVSLLRPLGYQVETAPSVAAGLEIARTRRPHLIISDVHMPGQSGFDFLLEVKADAALRDIPFLLASATSWGTDSNRQAEKLGAMLFLMRPVDPEKLLTVVKKALGAGSS